MGSNAALEIHTIQRHGDDYVSASPAVLMIIMSTHDDDGDGDGGADDDDDNAMKKIAGDDDDDDDVVDDDDDDDNYHRSILCISNGDDNFHRGNASAAPFPCASPFQEQGSADLGEPKGLQLTLRRTLANCPVSKYTHAMCFDLSHRANCSKLSCG